MSTYIVSDIHGCNATFRRALKTIRLQKTDHLIILGDLIDRGNDSKGVLDTIFLLIDHGFTVTCVRGNHEQMLLDAFDDITNQIAWIKNGGRTTLQSFLVSDINKIPARYVEFIASMPFFLDYGSLILVHAGINMQIEDPFSDSHSMIWLRNWEKVYDSKWLNNRRIIHGHTPMPKGQIENQLLQQSPIFCVDNGVFLDREGFGSLCVLRLEDFDITFVENV